LMEYMTIWRKENKRKNERCGGDGICQNQRVL